jgi:general secretion pathway protein J
MAKKGFTLIELMIAIMVFAIISLISYRIIVSLLTTKEVVKNSQGKWGSVAQVINKINSTMENNIPLTIRDENGLLKPAIYGKNKIENKYDSQLEVTISGSIGDIVYGSTPPKRLGFRYDNNKLFLVSWPVLNRVITTVPRLDVLLDNVKSFKVEYYYRDKQWRDTWPLDINSFNKLPLGLRITIELFTGEIIFKQWAIL